MDNNWLEHLKTEYGTALLKYLKVHTRSNEDAEDIFQEVFLSVFEHSDSFDPERCSEQAWLYIIAKRKLIDHYRKSRSDVSLSELENFVPDGDTFTEQAENLIFARQQLAKALRSLDERSRKIVILRYLEGYDTEQTAKMMNLSLSNARTILSRALRKMQNSIEEDEP